MWINSLISVVHMFCACLYNSMMFACACMLYMCTHVSSNIRNIYYVRTGSKSALPMPPQYHRPQSIIHFMCTDNLCIPYINICTHCYTRHKTLRRVCLCRSSAIAAFFFLLVGDSIVSVGAERVTTVVVCLCVGRKRWCGYIFMMCYIFTLSAHCRLT